MNCYTYNDLTIGKEEEFEIEITQDMMSKFLSITGDINPLHNDVQFANEHGYDQKVVYGMLTASFLSTLVGVYLPGKNCLIQSVDLNFVRPVYVGDILHVVGRIIELNDTVKQIVLKVDITNQSGIKVLRGKMKTGVLE